MTSSSSSELREEIEELRAEIKSFSPGDASRAHDRIEFPEHLFIGLFGQTGCGKTSLINSLKIAALGRLRRAKWLQVAGQEKAGGHTMHRKLADLTKAIYVVDNRGLDEPNTQTAIEELEAQLDGKRGYGEQVVWQDTEAEFDPSSKQDADADDVENGHQIHCAVFVFSARHDINTNTNGLFQIVDFLHVHLGRYPVAVVTHVDEAEKKDVENLTLALKMSGISDIFQVANVTDEKAKLEETYQLSLLSLLERCTTDGDETVIFKHNQPKDSAKKKELERRQREKEQQEAEKLRLRQEAEQRAKEERQIERQIEEMREMFEREKLESDMKFQLEKHKMELERERDRIAAEEREREQKFQASLDKMKMEKELELNRMMRENQNQAKQPECSVL